MECSFLFVEQQWNCGTISKEHAIVRSRGHGFVEISGRKFSRFFRFMESTIYDFHTNFTGFMSRIVEASMPFIKCYTIFHDKFWHKSCKGLNRSTLCWFVDCKNQTKQGNEQCVDERHQTSNGGIRGSHLTNLIINFLLFTAIDFDEMHKFFVSQL